MRKKLSVRTLREGSRLHSSFILVPRSNLAVLQPCSLVSTLALVNAALQSFLFFSWPWNQAMGAGRKDWVSSLLF